MSNMKHTLQEIADEAIRLGQLNGQGFSDLDLALDGLATWERNYIAEFNALPPWYSRDALLAYLTNMLQSDNV